MKHSIRHKFRLKFLNKMIRMMRNILHISNNIKKICQKRKRLGSGVNQLIEIPRETKSQNIYLKK